MRRYSIALLVVLGGWGCMLGFGSKAAALSPEEMVEKIHWLGFSGVKIEAGDKIIYIDPYKLVKSTNDADIVLITHSHEDNLSPTSLQKVANAQTQFIAPENCVNGIKKKIDTGVLVLNPGMHAEIDGILIEAVPAYTTKANVGVGFSHRSFAHPQENNWVGYLLTIDGVKIYHAGHTNLIPEMQGLTCDIVMLPVVKEVMSEEEAAETARALKAKIVIPILTPIPQYLTILPALLKDEIQVVVKKKE